MWISFYSLLIAIPTLVLVGFSLSTCPKERKKLKKAKDVEEIKKAYLRIKRCIKCRAIIGLFLYVVISIILLLYIICFCHIASHKVTYDWLRSSVILVVLDLVILELVPGILFGVLGLFYGFCRKSK